MAEDIACEGIKTEPTTTHQIDGVRLSETKGAHMSQTLIIEVYRTVNSCSCGGLDGGASLIVSVGWEGSPKWTVDSDISRRLRDFVVWGLSLRGYPSRNHNPELN